MKREIKWLEQYEEREKELQHSIQIAEYHYLSLVDNENERRDLYNETFEKAERVFQEFVSRTTKVRNVLSRALAVDLLIWLSSIAAKKIFLNDREGLTIIDAKIVLTFYSFLIEATVTCSVFAILRSLEGKNPVSDKYSKRDVTNVIRLAENRSAFYKTKKEDLKLVKSGSQYQLLAQQSKEKLIEYEAARKRYRDALINDSEIFKEDDINLQNVIDYWQQYIEIENINICKMSDVLTMSRVFALFTHAGVIDLAVKVLGAQNCMAGQSIYIPMLSILLQSYVERCADKADFSVLRRTEWKCLNIFNAISCAHSAALLYYGSSGLDAAKPMILQASMMLAYRLVCDDETKLLYRA